MLDRGPADSIAFRRPIEPPPPLKIISLRRGAEVTLIRKGHQEMPLDPLHALPFVPFWGKGSDPPGKHSSREASSSKSERLRVGPASA
jgi:hypothetical protein